MGLAVVIEVRKLLGAPRFELGTHCTPWCLRAFSPPAFHPHNVRETPRNIGIQAHSRAFIEGQDKSGEACVINILLLTGQRRGELALARWSDISFEEKTWTIPDEHSKSGRGHIVPLSEWAVKEFRALKSLAGTSA